MFVDVAALTDTGPGVGSYTGQHEFRVSYVRAGCLARAHMPGGRHAGRTTFANDV